MAWRFKVSKFKNSAPKFPKKEEQIYDILVGNAPHSCGNHIKASCVYMAFNLDTGNGGCLGYLPLNAKGRMAQTELLQIYAHGDFVTDFDFSPFDDYMLATGSQDNSVKIWLLPNEDSVHNISEADLYLPHQIRRIENVLWHPAAEGVLAASCDTFVKVFDVASTAEKYVFSEHGDQVQNISWRTNGSTIVTTCRDKQMRIIDVRASKLAQKTAGHQNVKDTRVLWLGNTDYILSTGFSSNQEREIKLWDCKNLKTSLVTQAAQGSTGALMCFFDADTNMVFFAGKSDNSIHFMELTDKSPYLTPGMTDRTEQVKGACLVPKRAVDLMSAEIDRMLLMATGCIVPVPYIVPRKSYRDFHADLYPDTASGDPALTAEQWYSGQDALPPTSPLQPNKETIKRSRRGTLLGGKLDVCTSGEKADSKHDTLSPTPVHIERAPSPKPAILKEKPKPQQSSERIRPSETAVASSTVTSSSVTSSIQSSHVVTAAHTDLPHTDQPPAEPVKLGKVFKGVRQSKYRYVTGKTLHPSHHLTNIKNISKTVPIESDMFAANSKRCAIPLEGAGGIVAVLELDKPGRMGDTVEDLPTIHNGSKVADLVWDPFDNTRLVVVCDNAKINVWQVPSSGFPAGPSHTEPQFSLKGHMEKIYFARFHPLVKDILMSTSYDMTVRMWNLDTRSEVMQLQGHQDQVFTLAWSPCGSMCATVCKDGMLRVYEPRRTTQPIRQGKRPGGARGARMEWVLEGKYLLVSGFDDTSVQQTVAIFDAQTLELQSVTDFHRSPSILIPFYDPDSSTVFLSCRGERTVENYDVSSEPPHLFGNTTINLQTLHQALSFLPRCCLDVRGAEVAKAWRLTNSSVEPVTFTVPRVRMEYFQDDLFPDTLVTWEPALTAKQWLAGEDVKPRYISLRPKGMKPLSTAPAEAPKPQKFESFNAATFKSDEQKKDELMTAIVGKLELSSEPLPQDLTEGVEAIEWDD